MKKILFPTDFSNPSLNALEYARRIADFFDAKITVLHVYTPHSGAMGGSGEFMPIVPDESEMMEGLMQNFLKRANGGEIDTLEKTIINSEILVGFPGDEIPDFADELGADLIIMGTRNEHNFADRIFGSVSTSTIRKAKCPVWVIPENAFYKGIDNILYATNHERAELKAIKESMALARQFGADYHYVHVNQTPAMGGYREEDKICERILTNDGKKSFAMNMATVQCATLEKGLEHYIEKNEIDLLVMLTHQKNLLEHLFFVSNTCKMAFHTTVPLLILRG